MYGFDILKYKLCLKIDLDIFLEDCLLKRINPQRSSRKA